MGWRNFFSGSRRATLAAVHLRIKLVSLSQPSLVSSCSQLGCTIFLQVTGNRRNAMCNERGGRGKARPCAFGILAESHVEFRVFPYIVRTKRHV
jgi:hypothetical protein